MATAADLVIAEVGELLPVGGLAAEVVHTPHLYVDPGAPLVTIRRR